MKITIKEAAMIAVCRSNETLSQKVLILQRMDPHYNIMDLVVKLADRVKRSKKKGGK